MRRLLRTLGIGTGYDPASKTGDWRPATYRVVAESCCCGNRILVGADASAPLSDRLDRPADDRIESQAVGMPWGEELDVALAIPRTS